MNEIVWAIRVLANAASKSLTGVDEAKSGLTDLEGEISCARADVDLLEDRLEGLESEISDAVEIEARVSDLESLDAAELECRLDEMSDELSLQEHRIGSLEAKGPGVVNEDLIHSLEKITEAVQHLYEKHGMAMDFDSEKAEEPKTEGGE